MKHQYYIIDAFTNEPFEGAQIAVFTQAENLQEQQMQLLARELNLSESVFVQATDDLQAPWRLKIFSPENQLEFAGHPTIAGCYALALENKITHGVSKVKQNIGNVEITLDKPQDRISKVSFSIDAPIRHDDFVPSAKELADMLSIEEKEIDLNQYKAMISVCENDYLIVPVKSNEVMDKVRFNINKWTTSFVATLASQVLVFCQNKQSSGVDFNARLFGKGIADNEDPPIGSAVPAFAAYLYAEELDGEYKAVLQRGGGSRRKSIIEASIRKSSGSIEKILVGGEAVQVGHGEIFLA